MKSFFRYFITLLICTGLNSFAAQDVKTVNELAIASVKTVHGLAIANVKTIIGTDNTAGGGGASAFTFVQKKTGTSTGAVSSVTMDGSITAGNLVVAIVKWETTTATLTGFTVNGGAGTVLTARTQSDLESSMCYALSATGGTSITLTWSGSATFSRIIVMEFDYGGTATFVTNQVGGADNHDGVSVIETADATNSGTHRLNVAGSGNYDGALPTTPRVGNTAGSEFTTESDTHMWYNTVSLGGGANDDADCVWTGTLPWTMQLASFAAN